MIGNCTLDPSIFSKEQKQDVWLDIKNKKDDKAGQLHIKAQWKTYDEVEKDFWVGFAEHFDADGNKKISFPEFAACLEGVGSHLTLKQSQDLFAKAPLDSENSIGFDEMAKFMSLSADNLAKNDLLSRFVDVEHTKEFIWLMSASVDEHFSIGDLLLQQGFYGKISKKPESAKDHIMVHDRETGKLVEEKIPDYIRMSLRIMYASSSGRFAVEKLKANKILAKLTVRQGVAYNNPKSKKEIDSFIHYHNLNTKEILDPLSSFKNFNEFFYRKLTAESRPIHDPKNAASLCSAADCRLNVFTSISTSKDIWIKGANFNLKNLLKDDALATEFDNCALTIFRLAPQDYHRFHSPFEGTLEEIRPFQGEYYTVNPIAVREPIDVYTENKRNICIFNTEKFGKCVYICVGATMVASIVMSVAPGQNVKKGDEIGYFAFGGSTILLLVKPNKLVFDEDLLANSEKPVETLVKMGVSLAKVPPM